jgi:hypothetical protein
MFDVAITRPNKKMVWKTVDVSTPHAAMRVAKRAVENEPDAHVGVYDMSSPRPIRRAFKSKNQWRTSW